jgi:hypothetical protein
VRLVFRAEKQLRAQTVRVRELSASIDVLTRMTRARLALNTPVAPTLTAETAAAAAQPTGTELETLEELAMARAVLNSHDDELHQMAADLAAVTGGQRSSPEHVKALISTHIDAADYMMLQFQRMAMQLKEVEQRAHPLSGNPDLAADVSGRDLVVGSQEEEEEHDLSLVVADNNAAVSAPAAPLSAPNIAVDADAGGDTDVADADSFTDTPSDAATDPAEVDIGVERVVPTDGDNGNGNGGDDADDGNGDSMTRTDSDTAEGTSVDSWPSDPDSGDESGSTRCADLQFVRDFPGETPSALAVEDTLNSLKYLANTLSSAVTRSATNVSSPTTLFKYICACFGTVMTTPSFLVCPRNVLAEFLRSDSLYLGPGGEFALFQALVRWARFRLRAYGLDSADPALVRLELHDLLPLVRFNALSPAEVARITGGLSLPEDFERELLLARCRDHARAADVAAAADADATASTNESEYVSPTGVAGLSHWIRSFLPYPLARKPRRDAPAPPRAETRADVRTAAELFLPHFAVPDPAHPLPAPGLGAPAQTPPRRSLFTSAEAEALRRLAAAGAEWGSVHRTMAAASFLDVNLVEPSRQQIQDVEAWRSDVALAAAAAVDGENAGNNAVAPRRRPRNNQWAAAHPQLDGVSALFGHQGYRNRVSNVPAELESLTNADPHIVLGAQERRGPFKEFHRTNVLPINDGFLQMRRMPRFIHSPLQEPGAMQALLFPVVTRTAIEAASALGSVAPRLPEQSPYPLLALGDLGSLRLGTRAAANSDAAAVAARGAPVRVQSHTNPMIRRQPLSLALEPSDPTVLFEEGAHAMRYRAGALTIRRPQQRAAAAMSFEAVVAANDIAYVSSVAVPGAMAVLASLPVEATTPAALESAAPELPAESTNDAVVAQQSVTENTLKSAEDANDAAALAEDEAFATATEVADAGVLVAACAGDLATTGDGERFAADAGDAPSSSSQPVSRPSSPPVLGERPPPIYAPLQPKIPRVPNLSLDVVVGPPRVAYLDLNGERIEVFEADVFMGPDLPAEEGDAALAVLHFPGMSVLPRRRPEAAFKMPLTDMPAADNKSSRWLFLRQFLQMHSSTVTDMEMTVWMGTSIGSQWIGWFYTASMTLFTASLFYRSVAVPLFVGALRWLCPSSPLLNTCEALDIHHPDEVTPELLGAVAEEHARPIALSPALAGEYVPMRPVNWLIAAMLVLEANAVAAFASGLLPLVPKLVFPVVYSSLMSMSLQHVYPVATSRSKLHASWAYTIAAAISAVLLHLKLAGLLSISTNVACAPALIFCVFHTTVSFLVYFFPSNAHVASLGRWMGRFVPIARKVGLLRSAAALFAALALRTHLAAEVDGVIFSSSLIPKALSEAVSERFTLIIDTVLFRLPVRSLPGLYVAGPLKLFRAAWPDVVSLASPMSLLPTGFFRGVLGFINPWNWAKMFFNPTSYLARAWLWGYFFFRRAAAFPKKTWEHRNYSIDALVTASAKMCGAAFPDRSV